MIDTVIFDCEGVVVDTEPIWDWGQEEFLRRRGFIYHRDALKPFLTGKSLVEGVRVMQKKYGFPGNPDKLAEERQEIVKDLFAHKAEFIAGFLEFFRAVKAHYKVCLATAMNKELLRILDGRLNLTRLFDGKVFTIADVNYRSKPHPDLFLYAASNLGSTPESCVVIEDSPYGIESAKRAGMKCIALATTYSQDLLKGADLVCPAYDCIDLSVLKSVKVHE